MSDQHSDYVQRDIASQIHPYTNLFHHQETGPKIYTRGEGIYVFDDQERRYIEGMAGLWCTALGFSEEELVQAATDQLRKLPYYPSFRHKATLPGIDLADKLKAAAPVPMSKVFFANSGSEANDTAVKIVWHYNNALGRPQKKKIISRVQAYHGVTIASASLTGIPRNHLDFDLPIDRFLHTDYPHHYRFARDGESPEDFATRLAGNLEKLILKEGPETIAAFIAEPVMGGGGVIVPPPTYYEKIEAVLRKYDVLFIADEVICGFGRTGNLWGTQTYDLHPDIITCAKGLSSAYLPIAAVLVNDAVFEGLVAASRKLGQFGHGFTYSGHPVCAAVALRTLELFEERDIVGHVQRMAPRFGAAIARYADHPLVGNVRSVGLMGAVELIADKATRKPFDPEQKVGQYFMDRAEEHGLIMRAIGETLALSPPLIITEPQIDDMFAAFDKAMADTAAWLRKG